MEELVSMYDEVLNHDSRDDGVRVFIYKNKNDLVKKYAENNLMKLKVSEPITGEKYDDTFKEYLDEINSLIKPFKEDEVIVVGVFGKYVDDIDIGNVDVRVYHADELDLLIEDVNSLYE
jgi:hypothetical protein